MIEPTHTRSQDWEGWPFSSVADAAEFVAELVAMVEEAAGSPPHLSATVSYEDRKYEFKSLGELREAAPRLDLDSMHNLSAMVFWSIDKPRPVGASFSLDGGGYHRKSQLRVSGTKGTAVDGVNVGAKAAVDRRQDRMREEKEEREREEMVARPAAPHGSSGDVQQSAWRRLLNHPYSIQIIGGIVAGLVVLVIAVVVFSQS